MHIFLLALLLFAILLDVMAASLLVAMVGIEWSGRITVFMVVRAAVLLPIVSLAALAKWIALGVWPTGKIKESLKVPQAAEAHKNLRIIGS